VYASIESKQQDRVRDNTFLLARVYSSYCAPYTAKEPSIHYEKTQLRLVAEKRPGGHDKVLFLSGHYPISW
jgi:hypothetical protein